MHPGFAGPRLFLVVALIALAGVGACRDPATAPPELVFSVQPDHQWAGGLVEITSTGGTLEVGDAVLFEADTFLVVSQRTDRAELRLPSDVDGLTRLSVRRDGILIGGATLEVYGYADSRIYPERLNDQITVLPVEGGESVVGPADNRTFAWIHPATGIHRQFPTRTDNQGLDLFHTGVDPVAREVFYECGNGRETVHVASIVGGRLENDRWIDRPCNRWGAYPLAGDIWIVPDWGQTCRVVSGPEGESCEIIAWFDIDDPLGIERLWSADAALVLDPMLPVFRMSTGELAYTANLPAVYLRLPTLSVATDEGRGVFYVSANGLESSDDEPRSEILVLRGVDGHLERTFETTGIPVLGYDQRRDILLLVRRSVWIVEARDAETFNLLGEIALPETPYLVFNTEIVFDQHFDRAFIVFSDVYRDDPAVGRRVPLEGTPVIEIRLPPS